MSWGQKLYDWVSPPSISLPVRLIFLLEQMYPNIDWKNTPCYDGIPWFVSRSFAIGIALPRYSFAQKRGIYIRDVKEISKTDFKSILIHEAYHIQQYEDLVTGLDWNFNCGFMQHYLGLTLQYLYDGIFRKKMPLKRFWAMPIVNTQWKSLRTNTKSNLDVPSHILKHMKSVFFLGTSLY